MIAVDPTMAFAEFTARAGLKPRPGGAEYGGLCHGLAILAAEQRGTIRVYVFSPLLELTPDLILDKFRSFHHLAEAGIPTEWLTGQVAGFGRIDRHCFLIDLTPDRLARIPVDAFLRLPELLALDLESWRNSTEPVQCSACGSSVAQQLYPGEGTWQFRCEPCSGTFHEMPPSIRWGRATAVLAGGTVLFGLGWGFIQQPTIHGHNAEALLMAPLLASTSLCRFVGKAARGMSLSLRLITVACILLALFSGNIWGYRSWLGEQGVVSWTDAAVAYFHDLPTNTNAGWYLLGGLAGAWLGFGILGCTTRPDASLPHMAAITFPTWSAAIDDDYLQVNPGL